MNAPSRPGDSGTRLQVERHRSPKNTDDIEMREQRMKTHEDDDDLGPLEGPPQDEDDELRRIMNCSGVKSIESTHSRSPLSAGRANAAETIPEPTNSQHTIALVWREKRGPLMMFRFRQGASWSRCPFVPASCANADEPVDEHHDDPADAPTAAASAGVQPRNDRAEHRGISIASE